MLLTPQVTVLDIQRMSTEDGPGLRTTLFLKGCSLRCNWCHNPESIDFRPVVQWSSHRCIGCDSCQNICPNGALINEQKRIRIDRIKCKICYSCLNECPSGALQVKGELWKREELLQELLKDRAYFGETGGVTLSGGEPLLQTDAVLWLLKELRLEGLKTALDTAGYVPQENLLDALEYTDLLLYDLKLFDNEAHRKHTGAGNEKIFANLLQALERAEETRTEIWIRTPLIPDVTATADNISDLARWLGNNLTLQVKRWELCAFNNLCENKYSMLDLNWPYRKTPLMNNSELDRLVQVATAFLGNKNITVHWTGSAANEKTGESGEADD
jgi:pyruvate formate lyase activating enzyme